MYRVALACAIALFISLNQAGAQSGLPGGMQGQPGGMPGGVQGGMPRRMRGRMPGGSGRRLPGPEVFEGPPNPPTLRQVVDLSDDQAKDYTVVYDSFMLATRPQRDSAEAARTAMRSAMESRDRPAAELQMAILRRQGDFLEKRQEAFEGVIKQLLTGDQYKAFRKYQDDRKKEAEAERRRRWER